MLYRQLKEIDWHVPTQVFEFYTDVPLLMKAADWIICKAGGLIVTEALACGKPMMLIDAIPGQETGNADYVVSNGAGDMALNMMAVLETTSHMFLENGRLLRVRTENAERLGRPNAAYDIASIVWQSAQRRALDRRRGTGRLRLIDLLTRNQIHWEDD